MRTHALCSSVTPWKMSDGNSAKRGSIKIPEVTAVHVQKYPDVEGGGCGNGALVPRGPALSGDGWCLALVHQGGKHRICRRRHFLRDQWLRCCSQHAGQGADCVQRMGICQAQAAANLSRVLALLWVDAGSHWRLRSARLG